MKKLIGLSLFIVFVVLYFNYDKKHYLYGYGCNFCNEKLPYDLEPKFNIEYPQTFYLLDKDKFELIGNGFRFYGSSFKIKNLLAYGYNDTSVIVKCTDSLNNIKYLFSYETKYRNDKGNTAISFKDLNSSGFEQINQDYYWVQLDSEKGDMIRLCRILSLIGAILTFLLLLRALIKKRKITIE